MIRRYILPIIILGSASQAVDFRYGQGNFEWSSTIVNYADSYIPLDDRVYSINEQHQNLTNSTWYYFGNMDIHSSRQLDTMTDISSDLLNIIPNTPDNVAPFPSSFTASGVDLDIGIGYDVYQDERSYFGLGLMTGFSTPMMETTNYADSSDHTSNLPYQANTEIETYKLGVTMQGAYNLAEIFSLYSSVVLAMQSGTMNSDIINSDLDIMGTYSSFDIGAKYFLTDFSGQDSDFYAKVGYTYKYWNLDDIGPFADGAYTDDITSLATTEITSDYLYLGIGYSF